MNKKKWLLISGIILLSLVALFIIYFDLSLPLTDIKQSIFTSFFISSFILSVLMAPLFEEIRFRGFLSKSKMLQGLFLLLIPWRSFVTGWNTLIFLIVSVIYCLYILCKGYESSVILDVIIIFSSLCFSFNHLPLDSNLTCS
jgi:membrane protease YdiL (CAAX protease family)